MFLKRCEPIIKRPYYVTSCVSYLIKEGSTEFWIDETSVAIYKDIQNEAITKNAKAINQKALDRLVKTFACTPQEYRAVIKKANGY